MENTFIVKAFLGSCVAGVSYLFGVFDIALQTLIFCITIDFIVGVYKGAKRHQLSSAKAFDGFMKKILTLIIVVLAVRLDALGATDGLIRMIAIYGFIGTELFSIIENLDAVNFPLPDGIRKYFIRYADESTKKGDML